MNPSLPRERPEWIITGVRMPDDTVLLIASTEIDHAVMESETEMVDDLEWDPDYGMFYPPRFPRRKPGKTRHTLSVEINTYVIIKAKTYAEAFASLMKHWNPDDQRSRKPEEIRSAQRAIDR